MILRTVQIRRKGGGVSGGIPGTSKEGGRGLEGPQEPGLDTVQRVGDPAWVHCSCSAWCTPPPSTCQKACFSSPTASGEVRSELKAGGSMWGCLPSLLSCCDPPVLCAHRDLSKAGVPVWGDPTPGSVGVLSPIPHKGVRRVFEQPTSGWIQAAQLCSSAGRWQPRVCGFLSPGRADMGPWSSQNAPKILPFLFLGDFFTLPEPKVL